MKKNLLLLFLFLFAAFQAFSQTGSVTGIVKDAETGESLPFCNVFVNNTTIATVTDMDGKYTLSGIESGPVEIGFSFMGYIAETKKITLPSGGTVTVNLSMKPFAQELSDVEIKASRDKVWERDLKKFSNLFIGTDIAANQTQILNPWVIDFPQAPEKNSFIAKAEQPIEIENRFLGYKISFNLKDFYDSPSNYRIVGAARFEEMTPDSENQRAIWEKNRAEVYKKSPMNMFRSILKGTQEREGFYLYGDKPGGSESRNMRSDMFANELGNSVIPYKADPLVTPTSPPGEYFINLKGRIEIHYQKGYAQTNTYKDAPYPISWLEVNGGRVKVRENGMVMNPQDLVFSGDMDQKRISNLLPLDYNAEKAIQLQDLAKTAKNYQEKVYLHTDKPYYYVGDQLFFKGFFAYGNPYLRDELSKVLHVELISADRDVVIAKKFQIFDGIVVGDFYLPDSISGGNYFLRAYTNWNRNYGPSQYFLQPLKILTPYQRVESGEENTSYPNQGVSIQADKTAYGAREKVNLSIGVQNSRNSPVQATLSVSVLDASQVVPIPRYPKMAETLNLEGIPESMGLEKFSYPVERTLTRKGKISDEKGKGIPGSVVAFVNNFEGMIDLEVNRDGTFALEDMEFYGPMQLALQGTDAKGKPVSKVELSEELRVPIALPDNPYFPKTLTVKDPIRPIEEVAAEELEQIIVEDTKLSGPKAIYGNPDYVISGEKLTTTGNSMDLVNSLAGNVPGMKVFLQGSSGQQQIRLRGGATSASLSMEPVVMLNGAMMVSTAGSTAAENLKTINPFEIDRVEVVTRTVSMLGDQGRNGVIAVYLKTSVSGDMGMLSASSKGLSNFIIEGFQPASSFFSVDYSQPSEENLKDSRQTLYWNPYMVTDEKGQLNLSFYTNDLAGPMTVEIRGLGVNGEIISGTFTINKK
jgi:hypothetical protein